MIVWNHREILVLKVELIDKEVRLMKSAYINICAMGEFSSQFFGERINHVCFDRVNLFLFIGTSKGSLITIDSKTGGLLGAQRVFLLEPIIGMQLDEALNLLFTVSKEEIKVLKLGYVSFDNQRMNRVMRQNWGYLV